MRKRILVVDDDKSIRESLKKVLEAAGYEVALAAGGLEAAVRFEPGQFDLLVLDLVLPNQSGWDVFERLTTQRPLVPVIIITGLPNQHSTAELAGAGALFEKPIEPIALLQTIAELLAESPRTRLERLCGVVQATKYVRAERVGAEVPGGDSVGVVGAKASGVGAKEGNARGLR
jgi:DNA-binding response OmpR family regulator